MPTTPHLNTAKDEFVKSLEHLKTEKIYQHKMHTTWYRGED